MRKILTFCESEIIKFLVFNGPSNKWEISEGTDISYQTVYSAVERLIKKFYIGIYKTETARNKLRKHYYFVTFIGKLITMAMTENDDDVLDLIATSEPRNFVILEEWEYISKNRLARDYILSILRTQFCDLMLNRSWPTLNLKTASETSKYLLTRSIFYEGYRTGGVEDPLKVDGLIQFFLANPAIREEMKKMLKVMEYEADQRLLKYSEVREICGFKDDLDESF